MSWKLALAGDTMLGRGVAERLRHAPPSSLFSDALVEAAHEADVLVLNLECCISERGEPWPDPLKPFHFRAPPAAVDALARLGVRCVTLANNHALDFGREALLDTIDHLEAAGIGWTGAGADAASARRPAVVEAPGGIRLAVVGVSDHPLDYAADRHLPGVAVDELGPGIPSWLAAAAGAGDAEVTLVTPHWGPNMATRPLERIRLAAAALVDAGATLVAGHSAHLFHGVEGRVLYDLGDFVDDYRTDPARRNDLGLLFLVTFEGAQPRSLEALPLKLGYCRTEPAAGDDAAWIRHRFRAACAELGTEVGEERGRLTVSF